MTDGRRCYSCYMARSPMKYCQGCKLDVCNRCITSCDDCLRELCRRCNPICNICKEGECEYCENNEYSYDECEVCGDIVCETCYVECGKCDSITCEKDLAECAQCKQDKCPVSPCFNECISCNTASCNECVVFYTCECGEARCKSCRIMCHECNHTVCQKMSCRNSSVKFITDEGDLYLCKRCINTCHHTEYFDDIRNYICKRCQSVFCNKCQEQCDDMCNICIQNEYKTAKNLLYRSYLKEHFYKDIVQLILIYP
jgi:hypothetical protein